MCRHSPEQHQHDGEHHGPRGGLRQLRHQAGDEDDDDLDHVIDDDGDDAGLPRVRGELCALEAHPQRLRAPRGEYRQYLQCSRISHQLQTEHSRHLPQRKL